MADPVKFGRFFTCETCEGKPEFDGISALRAHTDEKHHESALNGTRTGIMHGDAKGYSVWIYQWKFNQVTVTETHVYPTGRK